VGVEARHSINEFDVPTPKSRPHDPAVVPDGSLWYTGQMANKLGRLDPATGKLGNSHLRLRILDLTVSRQIPKATSGSRQTSRDTSAS